MASPEAHKQIGYNMKALSIQQPWAAAILYEGKDVENRTWKTNYRGWFLIHAGKKVDKKAVEDGIADTYRQDTGCIIGVSSLWACTRGYNPSRWAMEGCWHFHLQSTMRFRVGIPCRGLQKFFKPKLNPGAEMILVKELERFGFAWDYT